MRRPGVSTCGLPHPEGWREAPRPGRAHGGPQADHRDEPASRRVEDEVVPRRDDVEQHEGRVERADQAHPAVRGRRRQDDADEQRVAEVHARNRGERVVEAPEEVGAQVHVRVRGDGVHEAEASEPGRRRGKDGVGDEREARRDHERVPDEANCSRWRRCSQTIVAPVAPRWARRRRARGTSAGSGSRTPSSGRRPRRTLSDCSSSTMRAVFACAAWSVASPKPAPSS